MIIGQSKVFVGRVGPIADLYIIRRSLMILGYDIGLALDRPMVDAARTDGRGCFRTQQQALREALVGFRIAVGAVVEAWDVKQSRETII